MANTYVLIASNTLSSSAASVTFSSIPATYTDLVLRVSTRCDGAVTARTTTLAYNGTTTGSYTDLTGNGSTASSSGNSALSYLRIGLTSGTSSTSNTFSSMEIYIPNYTGTVKKPASSFYANENNTTAADIGTIAALQNETQAVNSVTISLTSSSFVTGSSFFLYGIKNS